MVRQERGAPLGAGALSESSWQGSDRRRVERRRSSERRKRQAAAPTGPWSDLHRPLRTLIFLLIAAALIQIYHQSEYIAGKIFDVLLLFVFAAIIALLLTPVVDRVQAFPMFQKRRSLAVLAVNLSLLLLLGVLIALLIPGIVSQAGSLSDQAPHLLGQAEGSTASLQAWLNARGIPIHLALPTNVSSLIAPALGSVVEVFTGVLGGLINLLLVAVIAIYLQIEGRDMIAALRQLFPGRQQFFDFTLVAAGSTLARYVQGQVIFAAIVAVVTAIALSVVGVHFALVIAVITFFLELVPLAGAPIAMALAVAIALIQGPVVTLEAAGATLAIHGALAYTLGMKIVGDATRIHPLVAMLALVLGAQLGGLLGALFAIPIAGILNVYLGALYRGRRGEEAFALPDQAAATTLSDLPNLGVEISQMAAEKRTADVSRKRAAATKAAPPAQASRSRAKAPPAKGGAAAKPTPGS
jgi:predicted PurR-regulated permease PerM